MAALQRLKMTSDQENKAILDAHEKPEGLIERELRQAIRNTIRLYGLEGARLLIAEIINDAGAGR